MSKRDVSFLEFRCSHLPVAVSLKIGQKASLCQRGGYCVRSHLGPASIIAGRSSCNIKLAVTQLVTLWGWLLVVWDVLQWAVAQKEALYVLFCCNKKWHTSITVDYSESFLKAYKRDSKAKWNAVSLQDFSGKIWRHFFGLPVKRILGFAHQGGDVARFCPLLWVMSK